MDYEWAASTLIDFGAMTPHPVRRRQLLSIVPGLPQFLPFPAIVYSGPSFHHDLAIVEIGRGLAVQAAFRVTEAGMHLRLMPCRLVLCN
jgi:hypothetical protein